MSGSLRPHGLYSPWNSGVGSLSLLQVIFPTQRSNPCLPHCRRILYQLSHKGNPRILEWVAYPFSRGPSQPRNRTGVSCMAGGLYQLSYQDSQRGMNLLRYNLMPLCIRVGSQFWHEILYLWIHSLFSLLLLFPRAGPHRKNGHGVFCSSTWVRSGGRQVVLRCAVGERVCTPL